MPLDLLMSARSSADKHVCFPSPRFSFGSAGCYDCTDAATACSILSRGCPKVNETTEIFRKKVQRCTLGQHKIGCSIWRRWDVAVGLSMATYLLCLLIPV